jgi:3'-5' exoribonuclease
MSRTYIADLKPGQLIDDQVFLIRSKDLRTTTNGSLYIHAILVDRSGEVPARAWQANESMFNALPEGGLIRLKGRTESYKGNNQFIIDAIRPIDPEILVDMAEFLPTTTLDVDAMWRRLTEILSGIKHPAIAALVAEFLQDEKLAAAFRRSPAALALHHAYLGGLLEHTLQLLEVALRVIPLYPKLNLDLVLAGLFVHDIGKTCELASDTSISYTDDGQLLGHIFIAANWIDQKADAVARKTGQPFPTKIRWALQHIVLSHHGRYEFGSPKLPAFAEAAAIHYLDNLDAKVHMFLAEAEGDRDPATHWTNYSRALETKVFKPAIVD